MCRKLALLLLKKRGRHANGECHRDGSDDGCHVGIAD